MACEVEWGGNLSKSAKQRCNHLQASPWWIAQLPNSNCQIRHPPINPHGRANLSGRRGEPLGVRNCTGALIARAHPPGRSQKFAVTLLRCPTAPRRQLHEVSDRKSGISMAPAQVPPQPLQLQGLKALLRKALNPTTLRSQRRPRNSTDSSKTFHSLTFLIRHSKPRDLDNFWMDDS